MIITSIPKSISLNTYRNTHYFKLNDLKAEHSLQVLGCLNSQKIDRTPLKIPCRACFTFHSRTKRRRDIDGEIPSVKFCLDSLVTLGLLPDDDLTCVSEITLRAGERKADEYDVEII